MSCPFFEPIERSMRDPGFRMPLGAFWTGRCGLEPDEQPNEDFQLNECNFGYVRGRCPQFPEAADADAVRFSCRGEERLFILEKDHVPVRFGPLREIEPATLLEKQAKAWSMT